MIDADDAWKWSVLTLALLVVGFLCFSVAKAACADGRILYCRMYWVQSTGPIKGYWNLEGYRSWRPDATLGNFVSDAEAREFAKAHNCELH